MSYLIFDIEGIIHPQRLLRVESLQKGLGDTEDTLVASAVERLCATEKLRSPDKDCFVPARFHAPTTIAMLLVDDQLRYLAHITAAHRIDHGPDFKKNTETFWQAYAYAKKTYPECKLVTFGGTSYDLTVLEVTALEYGIPMPGWMVMDQPAYADPRNVFSTKAHLDLSTYLSKSKGGTLAYYSRLIGLPGKLETSGSSVAGMIRDGAHDQVTTYCWLDVVNLYGVFMNTLWVAGMTPAGYRGNPIFEDVMAKCFAGLGPEAKKFQDHYALNGQPF